ncbi:MAG TPA: sulfatase-like hydrolase/transferase [Verrucomicrobiae bacterium]|jgi:phosphoglycerol transferase MdoB-like AlkP superfamily enzyme|nr:sulfatase-like hydrolase/transferase [Verrucomicrobiae bacterium]
MSNEPSATTSPADLANPAGGAPSPSSAVWNRIAIGFAALSIIKLIMLAGLRKELFQIHYRVGGEVPNWLNPVVFYLFAALAGLNLWKLSAQCMRGGARVVRAANACVLFAGAVFILLSFHEGENNYLHALMSGILGWKNLSWYLISNACFRMPYLAAWILGYGFVYFAFWRHGREHLMLRVTAVFAAAYIAVCMGDFMDYRDELAVVDCLGIACLILSGSGFFNPFWMVLPLLGAGSLFILFHPYQPGLGLIGMNPEFAVLLWTYVILLGGVALIARKRGFLNGWWGIAPFALATFLLINTNYPGAAGASYPAAANYENLLCMGFMLPRYFLGEIGLMVVLLALAVVYRRFRPAGTLLWLDAAILLLVTVALADLRLTQIMGVRLDWDVLSLAAGETTKMMWRMSRPYLPSLVLALAIVTALYALSLWALRRVRGSAAETAPANGRSFAFAVVACILLGTAGIALAPADKAEGQTVVRFVESTPWFKRTTSPVMDRAKFLKTAAELGMTTLGAPERTVPTRDPRDLNVVLIFQESTYNQHLSLFGSAEDTQPLLSQYKDRMELFPNFFSVFAGSMNARFATFTGLYPLADYHAFTAERVPVKSIFETLHDHGYSCSLFYSSFFDYTDFRDFLRNRDIDGLYDADSMPGKRKSHPVSWGLQEEDTLDSMRAQIKTYAAGKQKFFLTYVPAAPHNPFDGTPRRFDKYKMGKVGDLTPFYLNELLYMDWTISSLLDQLKESGLLDKTLVVITADHGEMLGENGGPVGHGWLMTPELANVPLIIMDPGHPGYRVNPVIGSQVDLMPTILDTLGIPVPSGELYQGTSLYSSDLNTNRTIYINTFRQYGILEGARFVDGDRETEKGGGDESHPAFDLTNQGSHTVFVPETSAAPPVPAISTFDQFQKNFLHNYSVYRDMFAPPPGGALK